MESSIAELQELIGSGALPLDEVALETAKSVTENAQTKIIEIPEKPAKTEEIQAATKNLTANANCKEILSQLEETNNALSLSFQQMQQVTNPPEEFVIERLAGIPSIIETQAVTEDHDPYHGLNKQGCYTAAVFFSSSLIDQSTFDQDNVVDKGNYCGGVVEVYSTVEDANNRDEYLTSFNGVGLYSPGSHSVMGTVVFRTSDDLTASQQTELETNIKNSFIEIR